MHVSDWAVMENYYFSFLAIIRLECNCTVCKHCWINIQTVWCTSQMYVCNVHQITSGRKLNIFSGGEDMNKKYCSEYTKTQFNYIYTIPHLHPTPRIPQSLHLDPPLCLLEFQPGLHHCRLDNNFNYYFCSLFTISVLLLFLKLFPVFVICH